MADEAALDLYFFLLLEGLHERECLLLDRLGKKRGTAREAFPPAGFGAHHRHELQRAVEYLRHGVGATGLSRPSEEMARSLVSLILNRQGQDIQSGYWTCAPAEQLCSETAVDEVAIYSCLLVAYLHVLLIRGIITSPSTRRRIVAALLTFFLNFGSKGGFPAHGHNIDLDHQALGQCLRLGALDLFVAEHAKELSSFLRVAEQHLRMEILHGPARSAFITTEPPDRLSELGEFCLTTLAEVQRTRNGAGRNSKTEPKAAPDSPKS